MDKKYILLIAVYLLSMLLGSQIFPITLLVFVIVLWNEIMSTIQKIDYIKLIKWGIIGAAAALLFQYGSIYMKDVFSFSTGSINTQHIVSKAINSPYTVFLVVLLAPALEEIVFRKIIFNSIKRKIGSIAAASISALLFSMIHFDFANLITYLVMGFIFSWIYTRSKSIIAPILAHVVMNSTVMAILM